MTNNYKTKYLKYKQKYISIKYQHGGVRCTYCNLKEKANKNYCCLLCAITAGEQHDDVTCGNPVQPHTYSSYVPKNIPDTILSLKEIQQNTYELSVEPVTGNRYSDLKKLCTHIIFDVDNIKKITIMYTSPIININPSGYTKILEMPTVADKMFYIHFKHDSMSDRFTTNVVYDNTNLAQQFKELMKKYMPELFNKVNGIIKQQKKLLDIFAE